MRRRRIFNDKETIFLFGKLPPSRPSPRGEGDGNQPFPLGGNGKGGENRKGYKTFTQFYNHKVLKLLGTHDGLLQKDI